MSDLLTILDEHRELLSERGYDEIGLGTAEEPGFFMQELERTFSHHIQASFLKRAPRTFDVKGVGFFNEEKDMLNFLFHYSYDPLEKKVQLKGLTAEWEDNRKYYSLEDGMHGLPSINKVIAQLQNEQPKMVEEPVVVRPDPNSSRDLNTYQQLLTDHHSLLVAKGYTDKTVFPYHKEFLLKKLEAKVVKAYWNESGEESQDFRIRAHGFFGSEGVEARFGFFYHVDRSEKVLHINMLQVDCKDKRVLYEIAEGKDLPTADQVWEQLTGKVKNSNVEVIYPKEKIKLLLKEQEQLLTAIGYYKTFFSSNSDFKKELQDILEKSLPEQSQKEISICRDIHLNLCDHMPCLFQYRFEPTKVNLTLEQMTLKVGEVQESFQPRLSNAAGFNLQHLYTDLSIKNQIRKAQRIAGAGEKAAYHIVRNRI